MRNYDPRQLTWTTSDLPAETVDYQGQAFPAHFTSRLTHPDWPGSIEVTVHVDPERGPVPTGLRSVVDADTEIESYRVQQSRLAATLDERMLVQELLAEALRLKVFRQIVQTELTPEDWATDDNPERDAVLDRARVLSYEELTRSYAAARPRRRRLLTAEHLQRVADVYRAALHDGDPPTVAVASAFGVSHSNASKYVKKARDIGALGPADSTRPGERDDR